jgi:hypothetical protein
MTNSILESWNWRNVEGPDCAGQTRIQLLHQSDGLQYNLQENKEKNKSWDSLAVFCSSSSLQESFGSKMYHQWRERPPPPPIKNEKMGLLRWLQCIRYNFPVRIILIYFIYLFAGFEFLFFFVLIGICKLHHGVLMVLHLTWATGSQRRST